MAQLQSLLGIFLIPLFAIVFSENRTWLDAKTLTRLLIGGIGLQLALALLLLGLPASQVIFDIFSRAINALQQATEAGLRLVFGYLSGGAQPFDVSNPGAQYILAFRALPIILIMSVLSKLLYHWGILQKTVAGFSWALRRTFGVSGPLGTATAANIFVGMVEAPILIKPYLATMSRSALFATMTAGMATVAGTVLALYAAILEPILPGAAGHLLVASVMSAPAAILLARLLVPEEPFSTAMAGQTVALDKEVFINEGSPRSAMDAVAIGTEDGLRLLAYVAAILIVMVALVALANMTLALVTEPFGFTLTFEKIVGTLCIPLAWIIGIPVAEIATAGELIGIKLVLNELLAYIEMARLPDSALSPRSRQILTYALCGFANLGSLGIMIGGLVAMVPERREDILSLGFKSVLIGALATLMTGAVVGLITPA